LFTEEIIEYLRDNLSKLPREIQSEVYAKFRVKLSTKQISNKQWYLRKRTKNTYGILRDNGSKTRSISQDASGTTSTNVPVSSTNLSPFSLLNAHGLDPNEFDLVRVWYKETPDGKFLSSIFAKPKLKGISLKDIIAEFKKDVKPIKITPSTRKGDFNYLINLADMHLGVTRINDLYPVLSNINDYFSNEKNIGTVIINLLGDEFHSSQVDESITLRGTVLDDVNMIDAIKDAQIFYNELFRIFNSKAIKVGIYRTPGNHDGNISYMFNEYLKAAFPNIVVNNTNNPRSYYKVGNIGVMITHGHLGKRQEYINLFASEGRNIFSTTKTNIILTGHRHFEMVEQNPAATIYQVGTCKPLDKWSNNQGFVSDARTRNWQIMKLNLDEIIGYTYV
jgi:hypothetical protein